MTRAELVAYLADLVLRKAITPAEANRTLELYDRGELLPGDLPTLLAPPDDDNEWLAALALLLLLIGGKATKRLTDGQRQRAQRRLRAVFEGDAVRLAQAVAGGGLSPQVWQEAMQDALVAYTRQMTAAGVGTLPNAGTRELVGVTLSAQWPYLQRFALLIAVRQLNGRPLSDRAINARSRQYGGVAWGAYYVGQGQDAQAGYVDVWYTMDDGHVCPRCAPRHLQAYRIGEGPYPGWDCLGSCRCRRVPEYNPAMYQQLTGQRVTV